MSDSEGDLTTYFNSLEEDLKASAASAVSPPQEGLLPNIGGEETAEKSFEIAKRYLSNVSLNDLISCHSVTYLLLGSCCFD